MKIGFVNFTPLIYSVDTPYKEPLGGSESALCYLAEALSKCGHEVILFGRMPNTFTLRGVRHEPFKNLQNANAFNLDFLIIQNTPYFGRELKEILDKKTKLVLWTQHAANQPAVQCLKDPRFSSVFDAMVLLSDWQLKDYLQNFRLEKEKCFILRNGISPSFENLFANKTNILFQKTNPPILAYTSTPFRGLDVLVNIFPKIREAYPNIKLKIYSSMQIYQTPAEEDEKSYGELYKKCRLTSGVDYVGAISQKKLAQELKKALILTYPNTFEETSCISVMEALSAGCVVVTSNFGALPETTAGFGHLITCPTSPQEVKNYENQFVKETIKILHEFEKNPEKLEKHLQKQVTYINRHHKWSIIAKEWEKTIIDNI